jgi:aspartate carbamoyltransferase
MPMQEVNLENPLLGKHVLTAQQFDKQSILKTMKVASRMHTERRTSPKPIKLAEGKVLANLFFEPSTRTASSFAAAMMKLGGSVVSLDEQTSSSQKGETTEDTIRTISQYADVIAMRHPLEGSVLNAAQFSTRPVINAGDGGGEHPTQALLDIFCIMQELCVEDLNGLNITLCGDLLNGRTVHSLSHLLSNFEGLTINCVAPDILQMPNNVVQHLKDNNVNVNLMDTYADVMPETDIFYMTRVQKERFETQEAYEACKGLYILTPEDMKHAKDRMAVMHPLPRVDEIDVGVDHDPRAAYFRQVGCGLSLRMALLGMVMGVA